MGKSTISIAIFNSYFDITRGYIPLSFHYSPLLTIKSQFSYGKSPFSYGSIPLFPPFLREKLAEPRHFSASPQVTTAPLSFRAAKADAVPRSEGRIGRAHSCAAPFLSGATKKEGGFGQGQLEQSTPRPRASKTLHKTYQRFLMCRSFSFWGQAPSVKGADAIRRNQRQLQSLERSALTNSKRFFGLAPKKDPGLWPCKIFPERYAAQMMHCRWNGSGKSLTKITGVGFSYQS